MQELRTLIANPTGPGKIRDYLNTMAPGTKVHIVFGGGGLLAPQFRKVAQAAFKQVAQVTDGRAIAWGLGQQIYGGAKSDGDFAAYLDKVQHKASQFPYQDYVGGWDLVGVRDDLKDRYWVPCASCMHPGFDKQYVAKHDFVVYSHRKFKLEMPGIPTLDHTENSMDRVLEFLGSGKTILTSSFHGAYWGTLLGRQVLAFPFTSKFITLKHPIALYPKPQWSRPQWQWRPFKRTFLNKINFNIKFSKAFRCQTKNWESYLTYAQAYPNALQECRERNQTFYRQVMDLVN